MTREYALTDEEYAALEDASRSVRYLVAGGRGPMDPQESANRVWQRVAADRQVIWDTIEPSPKGARWFRARPR